MKMNQRMTGLLRKLGKYKYTALVLILGILLMLLPQKNEKQTDVPVTVDECDEVQQEEQLEEKLIDILQKMDGVGKVDVLLSMEYGTSYRYQTDNRTHKQEASEETETETVLISDGTKGEQPITVSTKYPTYQGALIICQGAGSASVRLQITQAVSDLTGLGSDKISVIKMKSN